MINSIFFLQIETALKNHLSFKASNHIVTTIEKMDIPSRMIHYFFGGDAIWSVQNAIWFIKTLKKTSICSEDPDFSPERLIAAVKTFLIEYKSYSKHAEFDRCQKELLSFRLNIKSESLDDRINPGFYTFAKDYFLYNSLSAHNHTLKYDECTHEIQIKYRGEYIPWSQAKVILDRFFEQNKATHCDNDPLKLSFYGRKGIQNKNRYNWSKPKPFLKGDTDTFATHFIKDPLIFDDECKGYIMELCSSATEKSPRILAGDHSWIRLYEFEKTDQKIIGKMYSIGLYRPGKQKGFFENFRAPFRIKKGFLTYDISEEWGMNNEIRTLAKRISKQAFNNMLQKITDDKQTDNVIFHLFQHNCDKYISDLAKYDRVQLPTRKHCLETFFYLSHQKSFEKKLESCPKIVQKAVHVIAALFKAIIYSLTPVFNFLLYLAGSSLIDKDVQSVPNVRPILLSTSDYFNSEKLHVYSPWILGHTVKEEIDLWREEEFKKIESSTISQEEKTKAKNEIAFAFPPQFITA